MSNGSDNQNMFAPLNTSDQNMRQSFFNVNQLSGGNSESLGNSGSFVSNNPFGNQNDLTNICIGGFMF